MHAYTVHTSGRIARADAVDAPRAKQSVFLLATALALAVVMVLASCSSGDGVAAASDTVSVSEDEVTSYTAHYRSTIDAEDDQAWARYLRGSDLDAKTWRERAIRELASRSLVQKRALELGIEADEGQVERSIASEKASRGIAEDDDDGWRKALAEDGTTPEDYRADLEYASILQQVVLKDSLSSSGEADSDAQAYIETNLLDRVTRRFSVLSFPPDEKKDAKRILSELKGLKGDERLVRFEELADERARHGDESLVQGDVGWNLLYDTDEVMDAGKVLELKPGDVYPSLVKRDEGWQIYQCTGRYVFDASTSYVDLDESLKNAVLQNMVMGSWSKWVETYVNDIVDEAHLQVNPMPSGLPYDVDDVMKSL